MDLNQNIKVAVDAVVFGYSDNKLKILLIQQDFGTGQLKWALPGGFVRDNESLDEAIVRELLEETGIEVDYLEQLYSFGKVVRDHRFRVVTIAYLALINPEKFTLKPDTDVSDAKWVDLKELPQLAFDHNKILDIGLERLRAKIHYQPIGFELLKAEFPFSDLENLYQTILNKAIDRRNFRKKILGFGFLQETGNIFKPLSGRPAMLYSFNSNKYKELEAKGFHFEIKFA